EREHLYEEATSVDVSPRGRPRRVLAVESSGNRLLYGRGCSWRVRSRGCIVGARPGTSHWVRADRTLPERWSDHHVPDHCCWRPSEPAVCVDSARLISLRSIISP